MRIRDIATIASCTLPKQDTVWLLNLDAVEQQTGKVIEYKYVSPDMLTGSTTAFDTNTVLYSKLRPNLNKVVVPTMSGYATSEMLPLRPDVQKCTREYLAFYLRSNAFVEWAISKTNGAKMPRLGTKDLLDKEIPVPSIQTQKHIVAVFACVESLIDELSRMLSHFDELVKSRFIEMFGGIQEEDILEHLCHFIDYRGKTPDKAESGLPFITAKNVRMHHMSFDTQEFISKETYDKVMTRGFPKIGDVVFTTEAPLGNVCRIPFIDTEFYIGQRIITMQTDILEPAYLEYALASEDFKKKIAEKSSGSTVTGIRSKLLEKLTIPVPPREMQSQFASFVLQTDKSKYSVEMEVAA